MRLASYVPGELIPLPLSGSIPELPHVAKVFLGGRTKFLRAADAFYARRREGPYRFIQNRPRTSVMALNCDAAARSPKIDFREIFWVVRFSTFATISAQSRHERSVVEGPLLREKPTLRSAVPNHFISCSSFRASPNKA